MDIFRAAADGQFHPAGRRCDRCRLDVRLSDPDLGALFRYQEFVKVEFRAGYGGEHFNDGDQYRCDLCERCVCELLGPFLLCIPDRWEDRLKGDQGA